MIYLVRQGQTDMPGDVLPVFLMNCVVIPYGDVVAVIQTFRLFLAKMIIYRLGRFNRKKEIIGEKLNGWRVTCTKGCLIS